MRALTLIRPMAAAIVRGTKRIENRPVNLPRAWRAGRDLPSGVAPQIVGVHAGKKWDDDYAQLVAKIDGAGTITGDPSYSLTDEGLVGFMLLSGRVYTADWLPARLDPKYNFPRVDPWYSGPFGYEIISAVALERPIPMRGMQGFWPLPVEVERAPACVEAVGLLAYQAELRR